MTAARAVASSTVLARRGAVGGSGSGSGGVGEQLRLDLLERSSARVDTLLAAVPLSPDTDAALAWLESVAALLGLVGDYDRARLLESRALVRANLLSRGEASTSRDFHRDAAEAAEIFERLGETASAATNFAAAAIGAVQAEQVGEALETAVRALVAFDALPEEDLDAVGEARMANLLGVLCYQFFDYERAQRFYEIAATALETPSQAGRWAAAAHNVAEVALLQARQLGWQAAPQTMPQQRDRRTALLRGAERLSRRLVALGEPESLRCVDGPRLLAGVLCERGRAREAWPLLERAFAAAGNPPQRGQIGGLRLTRGRCLQLLGRPAEALVELDAALALFDPDWDLAEYIVALQLRSAVREAAGDLAGALADERTLSRQIWGRHQRQVGGLMDQVWQRAGAEGQRRHLEEQRRHLEEQTKDLVLSAEQDPLTGLANRRALERFCAALPPGESVCLVLVDVDHFKQVNDLHGHAVGDDVLRTVASVLSRCVRSMDRVARWGGEEFVLALPGGSGDLGREAAGRVRQRVQAQLWDDVAAGLRLTVSAGVACGPAVDLAAVMRRADAALYTAKREGRNRVVVG